MEGTENNRRYAMKKMASVGILMLLSASLVFAQGGKETAPAAQKEPVTIRVWAGIQPEYGYSDLIDNFNAQFKDQGIQAEYVRYVNDTAGNLQLDTYLMGGNDIDVFLGYGGVNRLIPRIESGLLLKLDEYLAKQGFDYMKEIGEGNLKSYLYQGNCYAIPTKYENSAWMLANADMFKKAGIPLPLKGWTYAQFREAAKKLTYGEGPDKVYGAHWWTNTDPSGVKNVMADVLGKNKTYKDDAASETNFDNPVWKQGLQFVVDTMRTDGSAIPLELEVGDKLNIANTFLAGKCAMTIGISQIRLVKDKATYPHDFVTALIPAPVPTEADLKVFDHAYIAGAGDLISVNSKTAHPEEAVKFLIWYIKGGMAPLAKGGRIPLWTGVSKEDVIKAFNTDAEGVFDKDSLSAYLSIRTNLAQSEPSSSMGSQISTVQKEEIYNALYGKKTVEQALKDMKSRSDKLLADAKTKK